MSVGKDKIANVMINLIDQKVENQIKEKHEEYQRHEDMILTVFREKEEEMANVYIEQELRDLKNDVMKRTVKSRWDYKKALFIRRNELVDELFEDVKEKLKSYNQSADYPKYIAHYLKECQKFVDVKECTFYIRKEDESYFKSLPKESEIVFDNTNQLGGFSCVSAQKGMELDYRIAKKLEEQRTWFINHSQLVIS